MKKKRYFRQKFVNGALGKGIHLRLQDAPRTEFDTEFTACGLYVDMLGNGTSGYDAVFAIIDLIRQGGEFKRGRYVLRNLRCEKITNPLMAFGILTEYDRTTNFNGIRVEKDSYAQCAKLMRDDPSSSYLGHLNSQRLNDELKPAGIQKLSGLFSKGEFILPSTFTDSHTCLETTSLLDEMLRYRNRSIGIRLRAMAYAYAEMRQIESQRVTVLRPQGFPRLTPSASGRDPRDEAAARLLQRHEEALRRAYNQR